MNKDNEKLRKYAFDENGHWIHVNSTVRGKDYYCANCHLPVFPRLGNIRQHHFAHNSTTELSEKERIIAAECVRTNEGYLHKTFKEGFYEILKAKIGKEEFPIFWNASNLGQQKGNLLRIAGEVKIEEKAGHLESDLKPDISLYDKNGNLYTAIEIVVSNKPSRNKLEYYSKKGITLYEIVLDKDDLSVLDSISEIAEHPTSFSYIPDPKKDKTIWKERTCENPNCKDTAYFSYINLFEVKCNHCQKQNRVAYISMTTKDGKEIKYHFNKYTTIVEQNILDSHGLLYNEDFEFICSNEECKAVLKFPISDIQEKQTYPLGYYCQSCHGRKNNIIIYKGQQFQNHAEEKWAQFLEAHNIEYEYNPKRFRFPEVNHFPVFFLTKSQQLLRARRHYEYEEIRKKEEDKANKLFSKTGLEIVLGFDDGKFNLIHENDSSSYEESSLVQCKKCGTYYFISNNSNNWHCKNCNHFEGNNTWNPESTISGDFGF
ncbi:hypothetical protein [Treponema bryantii]|uniref:competence protein CoiA family protein n=1 Tax=Treponema bryantii TaxID=163 RepID=UPI0003B6C85C|nr:hypothetical protein [Treponema bryantii]